jgi:hypothetical protein
MQPKVHISIMTTLPRKSARRRGESTFSQMVLVSSGAGPRSGREAGFAMGDSAARDSGCPGAHPKSRKAIKLNRKCFIVSLSDGLILRELPYEKIT